MQKGGADRYTSANVILTEKEELGAVVLGDCISAVDKHVLRPNKISTILTFGHDSIPEKKEEQYLYRHYNIVDNKQQKIGDLLDEVCEEVEQARKNGGVLLHCYTGISRSPSFAIAYLMSSKQMTYDAAKAFVRKRRAVIHPSDTFHHQLKNYQKVLNKRIKQKQEQRKMANDKTSETTLLTSETTLLTSETSLFTSSLPKKRGLQGAVRKAYRSIPSHQPAKLQNQSLNCSIKENNKQQKQTVTTNIQKIKKSTENISHNKNKVN